VEQLILQLAPPPAPALDNYLAGPNRGALRSLHELIAGSERAIHLWGPRGSGRTHLLRAAAAAVAAAGGTAAWAPGEAGSGVADTAELVLCDDADALGAEGQAAAFAMLDAARLRGARLLTAALAPAHELRLREDLRTRLGQSLSVGLAVLSDAEKRAAIAARAAERSMALGEEVIDYVITRVRRDMGTLMQVLEAIDRESLAAKRAPSVPLARELLLRLEL